MKLFAIRFSDGCHGPLVTREVAERALANVDPMRRPFCSLTCWEEVTDAETLRPPAEDPFSEASIRKSKPMSGRELIEAVRNDPVLDAAFERMGSGAYGKHFRAALPTLDGDVSAALAAGTADESQEES